MKLPQIIMAATSIAMISHVLVWLLYDPQPLPPLLQDHLKPAKPKKKQPDSPVAVARTILEAFLADRREVYGDKELIRSSPIEIQSAVLPWWLAEHTNELDEPMGAWRIEYDGERTAIATTPDGVQLTLDARIQTPPKNRRTLFVVKLRMGGTVIIKVAVTERKSFCHYRTRGWGRFRRYERTAKPGPGTSTITGYFQQLDTSLGRIAPSLEEHLLAAGRHRRLHHGRSQQSQ